MAVHQAVMHDLGPSVAGAIARDVETGDWVVLMSPRVAEAGSRCAIFNGLMKQLAVWERRGYSTAEVRRYLRRMKRQGK